jgi:hypothetical protein
MVRLRVNHAVARRVVANPGAIAFTVPLTGVGGVEKMVPFHIKLAPCGENVVPDTVAHA